MSSAANDSSQHESLLRKCAIGGIPRCLFLGWYELDLGHVNE